MFDQKVMKTPPPLPTLPRWAKETFTIDFDAETDYEFSLWEQYDEVSRYESSAKDVSYKIYYESVQLRAGVDWEDLLWAKSILHLSSLEMASWRNSRNAMLLGEAEGVTRFRLARLWFDNRLRKRIQLNTILTSH